MPQSPPPRSSRLFHKYLFFCCFGVGSVCLIVAESPSANVERAQNVIFYLLVHFQFFIDRFFFFLLGKFASGGVETVA